MVNAMISEWFGWELSTHPYPFQSNLWPVWVTILQIPGWSRKLKQTHRETSGNPGGMPWIFLFLGGFVGRVVNLLCWLMLAVAIAGAVEIGMNVSTVKNLSLPPGKLWIFALKDGNTYLLRIHHEKRIHDNSTLSIRSYVHPVAL